MQFEFFHRVDSLHVDDRGVTVDAITLGRQVLLADGVDHYDPLVDVGGLAVFPSAPRGDQIQERPGLEDPSRITPSVTTSRPRFCSGAKTSITSYWRCHWA